MNNIFGFGEKIEGYRIPMLNEREARAGAGILLMFAIISFSNSFLLKDFIFTKVFLTFFMFDFFTRVLINPRFSPSLILGRIMVRNQNPEYVGAPQKRFAWSIGLILSVGMFITIVIMEAMTPIKLVVCFICMSLLFFETSLGICLGCILYNKIPGKKAEYCPGESCEIKKKHEIQKVSMPQYVILVLALSIAIIAFYNISEQSNLNKIDKPSAMKCAPGKCGR